MDLKTIPKQLLENREVVECNFIFCLYKEPDFFQEYNQLKNTEDIITEDGIFYYGLAANMVKAGYQVLDHMSIYDYIQNKEVIKNGFEKRGGYGTIKEITDLLSTSNIEVYYNELLKSNLLIRLYKKNFNVLTELEKFKTMTVDEVYDYWEYQLSDTGIVSIDKTEAVDLSNGYKNFIEKWDSGEAMGYPIALRMLNYKTLGIHKKNLTLHCAGIGWGKTTTSISWYIIPAIKNGNDVVVIVNEQSESDWRQMLLATVVFNELKEKAPGFNRHKIKIGSYTEEQKKRLYEAEEWLKNQPGKVIFISTDDYGIGKIKKILKKFSKRGVGLFLIDTLKNPDDASERAWGELINTSKEIFQEAKNLDIAVIATAQLASNALQRKYLDLTCIGKSRGIAEVCDTVIMFRHLTVEERTKVRPYRREGKIKHLIDLDPDKNYIMIFLPKNRNDSNQEQIIAEANMDFNYYKDVGWFECSYDTYVQK